MPPTASEPNTLTTLTSTSSSSWSSYSKDEGSRSKPTMIDVTFEEDKNSNNMRGSASTRTHEDGVVVLKGRRGSSDYNRKKKSGKMRKNKTFGLMRSIRKLFSTSSSSSSTGLEGRNNDSSVSFVAVADRNERKTSFDTTPTVASSVPPPVDEFYLSDCGPDDDGENNDLNEHGVSTIATTASAAASLTWLRNNTAMTRERSVSWSLKEPIVLSGNNNLDYYADSDGEELDKARKNGEQVGSSSNNNDDDDKNGHQSILYADTARAYLRWQKGKCAPIIIVESDDDDNHDDNNRCEYDYGSDTEENEYEYHENEFDTTNIPVVKDGDDYDQYTLQVLQQQRQNRRKCNSYPFKNREGRRRVRPVERVQEEAQEHREEQVGGEMNLSSRVHGITCTPLDVVHEHESIPQKLVTQVLPPSYPQIISIQTTRNNNYLTSMYDRRSEDPCIKARMEAIQVQKKLLGEDHPDVVFALNNIGKVHYRRGEYEMAQQIYDEARRLTQKSLGQYGELYPPSSSPLFVSPPTAPGMSMQQQQQQQQEQQQSSMGVHSTQQMQAP